jgi:hypothetical protein
MITTANASVTRPANTTAYTAGDVVGTEATHLLRFQVTEPKKERGTPGKITRAKVICDASQATNPTLELWLFTRTLAAQADHAAFAVTDAEALTVIGVIQLATAFVGYASNNHVQQSAALDVKFEIPANSGIIYGCLVVRNAYTPVSGETMTAVIEMELD